jgi:hypothetical protein
VDPRCARGGQSGTRAWTKQGILADQRAVEVAREGLDVPREVPREF